MSNFEEFKGIIKNFSWSHLTVNFDAIKKDDFFVMIRYLEHEGVSYPVISYYPRTPPIFTYPNEFHRFVDSDHPYIRGRIYILCDELIREFDQLDISSDNYYVIPFEEIQEAVDHYNIWPLGFEMAARQHGESVIDFVPVDLKATYPFPERITTWEGFYKTLDSVLNQDYGYIEERRSVINYLYGLSFVKDAMSKEAIKAAKEILWLDIANQYQGSECYEVTGETKIEDVKAVNNLGVF